MTERGALLGGRYKLDQVIGRGGMAEVWRARDLRLERDVAVKRLRVDLASDPTFQARFRREAQSAAGLNHPNIVAVYDTGEEKDTSSDISVPYIVMELVEGVTLREVLRDGRKILPERALEFTAGVLDALSYSHRAGIIHRDIKPANVMLTPNGTVKVMDFGIARAVADTSATMTQTAAVIGTAQYLSPEQARGEKVDNRSDIYSVGTLLYELLTSQPLFKGDSPVSVAYQHVREAPVPPSQIDDEITPEMDAIVLKSLAKDPRNRYQDASEMREDILRALNNQPVLAVAPEEQPTRVITSEPMTTTARRGVVPAGTQNQQAVSPDTPDGEVEEDEQDPEPKKSRKGLIIALVLAGVVLVAIGITLFTFFNPSAKPEPSETPVAMVEVPDLTGQSEAAAVAMLTREGLLAKVERVAGTADDRGQVVGQDPVYPKKVQPGSTVIVNVSSGPETKAIPDGLTGVPYATAKSILENAGFTNVAEPVEADPRVEPVDAVKGNVISSDPGTGEQIALDTEIKLTVATGQSVLPRLTGLTPAQAEAEAERVGLKIKVNEVETDQHQAGVIFAQDPEPGPSQTFIDRSVTINVDVAVAPPDPTPTPTPTPTSTPPTSNPPETPVSPDPTPGNQNPGETTTTEEQPEG